MRSRVKVCVASTRFLLRSTSVFVFRCSRTSVSLRGMKLPYFKKKLSKNSGMGGGRVILNGTGGHIYTY